MNIVCKAVYLFEIRDQSWIEKFISLGAKIFSLATLSEGVGRGVGHTFFIVFPFRKGIPRFKGKASYAVSLCPLLYSDPLQYPDTGPGTHTQRHTTPEARYYYPRFGVGSSICLPVARAARLRT